MNNKPKKKLAARIYEAIFPPKAEKRTYASAKVSRLNSGWTTNPTGANFETRVSLPTLIARSREAARDDLHIVNYLRLMRANVIGTKGIQLQSNAQTPRGKLNMKLNKRVEDAWWKWGHAEYCTVSGKLDWKGVQDMAVTHCERDGAFLIQMVEANNSFGFALKVWDILWLDLTWSDILPNGNRVIMSVEVDDNNKPVAYWLTTPPTENPFATRQEQERRRRRIPAEQMIHGVIYRDDESQVQGIPGTAAALLPAKLAAGYNTGVVTQARVAANTFGVLENIDPTGEGQFEGKEDEEGNAQHPFIDSAPLSITPLLPGWKLNQYDPKQPTQNHAAFKETLDMDIAVALGVPYFMLMDNWKAVNFSSSRGGLGEFRDRCKAYQHFIATTLCRRVFNQWLSRAMLSGQLELTSAEFLQVQDPAWQGRGFDYIDPTKDISASVEGLSNNILTLTDELAKRGIDRTEHFQKIQAEREEAKSMGIDLVYVTKVTASETADANAAQGDSTDTSGDASNPAKRELANGHGYELLDN